jgi:hypothetical protein
VTHHLPQWSPPRTVEELARTAYLLARWDGTPYLRLAERLDNLRIRLGATIAFDTELLAWIVIVPGYRDGDRDEIVQTASMTELCDAMDAMVTRRTLHVEEHTRQALAALAVFWALDFRIGYDKTNDECWADPVRGRPRITAPTPEALNKLMADAICYPPSTGGTGGGSGMSVPGR